MGEIPKKALLYGISTIVIFSLIIANTPVAEAASWEIILPEGTSVPGCEEANNCYVPAIRTIGQGDTVTWWNDDTAAHTVTSGTPEDGPDGFFDSSLFMAGEGFEVTFDEPGNYEYFCMVHPWMVGAVIVSTSNVPDPGDSFVQDALVNQAASLKEQRLEMERMQEEILKDLELLLKEIKTTTKYVEINPNIGVPGCEETSSCYLPNYLQIEQGDTIIWDNIGSVATTVTSGTPEDGPDDFFDSSILLSGESFEVTFFQEGVYDYFSLLHPWATGTIEVVESGQITEEYQEELKESITQEGFNPFGETASYEYEQDIIDLGCTPVVYDLYLYIERVREIDRKGGTFDADILLSVKLAHDPNAGTNQTVSFTEKVPKIQFVKQSR